MSARNDKPTGDSASAIPAYCPRCQRRVTSLDQIALTPSLQRVILTDTPQWDDIRFDPDQGEYGYATGYQCPQCRYRYPQAAARAIAKRVGSTYHRIDMDS